MSPLYVFRLQIYIMILLYQILFVFYRHICIFQYYKSHILVFFHLIEMNFYYKYLNYNRNVSEEKISEQEAVQKGKEYLASKGFNNMQETYYMKENGFITVNYAYKQNDVIMYADLIKVKIALDNGEIIGLETTGYLNCHYDRKISANKISVDEARKHLSSKAQITSEGLAMIPTEWKTEKFCYEFKGKIEDMDFIAYINAENGEEEDILIVTNTPNGTLTE